MASDNQQFTEALRVWEQLHREGVLSVPAKVGSTAIICSGLPYEEPGTDEAEVELEELRQEAHALADLVRSRRGKPEVVIDATKDDMTRLLQDPNIASVYTVGNGNLSSLNLETPGDYDWRDVARNATHLKCGLFIQRHCGLLSRATNVPLGLFAVTNPKNVLAPVGHEFNPQNLCDPENSKVRRVFRRGRVSYQDVKSLPRKFGVTSES